MKTYLASNKRIALLTAEKFLTGTKDWYSRQIETEDNLLVRILQKRGCEAQRMAWSDPKTDWSGFDAVVFRTTWDYFDRFPEFSDWLVNIEEKTRVFNPIEIIRWNAHKSYLLELERKGIPVTPIKQIRRGENPNLSDLFSETNWEEAIVKPAISGAGRNTFRIPRKDFEQWESRLNGLLMDSDYLFQQFEADIMTEGEISLIFFEKEFSHAVKKTAKEGDFRVQDDHGGKVSHWDASLEEIDFGLRCMNFAPETPLYSRVDILKKKSGKMVLMELELIEPELFFRFCPEASEHMVRHLLGRLT